RSGPTLSPTRRPKGESSPSPVVHRCLDILGERTPSHDTGNSRRAQSAQKQLTQDAAAAPRIPRRPQERTMHGDTAVIDHGWLRTLDPAEIVAHLDAENAHTAHRTAHLAELRSALARELTAPEPPTELFVPVRNGGWWYLDRPRFLAGHGMDVSLSRVPDS